MKTSKSKQTIEPEDDLLPEYRFDYKKAKPNRFAPGVEEGSMIVVLDPEIASVFKTPESVVGILRALINALPKGIDG